MNMENIATPQEEQTPEHRYAALHRAVERGMASEEVHRELVETCLRLGHVDEAVRVHAAMAPGAARDLLTSRLVRQGVLHAEDHPTTRRPLSNDSPSLRDYLTDALQSLGQGYMPAMVLMTMLAFPVVVGLGGFLTGGQSFWLLAAVAAIPGLAVVGVIGAVSRRIFLDAAEGAPDQSPVPSVRTMAPLAGRHLGDFGLVLGSMVLPSLLGIAFGMPLVSAVPCLLLGMYLVPSALLLRHLRGDFGALSPVPVVRVVLSCRGYSAVALVFWLAFAPAALAMWTAFGHAMWLQIAIVGPLAVVPMFALARLLGTFAEEHRERLLPMTGGVTTVAAVTARKAAAQATPASAAVRRTQPPVATPKRAAAATTTQLPPAQRAAAMPKATAAKASAAAASPTRPVATARPAVARPAVAKAERPAAAAQPAPVAAAAPTRPVVRATAATAAVEPHRFAGPDLSNLPGARVISAAERAQQGAASRRS